MLFGKFIGIFSKKCLIIMLLTLLTKDDVTLADELTTVESVTESRQNNSATSIGDTTTVRMATLPMYKHPDHKSIMHINRNIKLIANILLRVKNVDILKDRLRYLKDISIAQNNSTADFDHILNVFRNDSILLNDTGLFNISSAFNTTISKITTSLPAITQSDHNSTTTTSTTTIPSNAGDRFLSCLESCDANHECVRKNCLSDSTYFG